VICRNEGYLCCVFTGLSKISDSDPDFDDPTTAFVNKSGKRNIFMTTGINDYGFM